MKAKQLTALGVAATIIGVGIQVKEPEWCKAICEHMIDPPHTPHTPHEPISTPVSGVVANGSSSMTDVPFVPFDDSANMRIIRESHRAHAHQIASMDASTSNGWLLNNFGSPAE